MSRNGVALIVPHSKGLVSQRKGGQRLWNAMCGEGNALTCSVRRRHSRALIRFAKAKNRLAPRGHGDAMYATAGLSGAGRCKGEAKQGLATAKQTEETIGNGVVTHALL